MKTKKQVEAKIEADKTKLLKLDFNSFFEIISNESLDIDLRDERIMKVFNKYYDRIRVEIFKDRTKFRTQLMRARMKELKNFYKKHKAIDVSL